MTGEVQVLVASADPRLRGQVALALHGERFEVGVAADTDQTVRRIAAAPPDVLLVDLHLQGAGALPLARTLRAQPETKAVRILVLAPAGTEVPGTAPGLDGVIAAPFTSLALLRRVEGLLEG